MIERDIRTGPGGCHAALIVKGEHFWCQEQHPHPGLVHSSRAAEAIWRGEGAAEDPAAAWADAEVDGR